MKRSRIKNKKALFLLGTGLGYQLKALLGRKNSTARIYAIEKHEQVFEKALQRQHWEAEQDLPEDVEFMVGQSIEEVLERLHEVMAQLDTDEYEFITNKPSTRLDPEYYRSIQCEEETE
ncbi:MAG: hypothetical protein ISR91_02870 [Candidatus Delongbacteria bacterium]|nr:hypothetical protein [Candidatus Delongbacteria bacterium]